MRIELMLPSNEEEKLKNGLLRILTAARDMNVQLDGEAFARAWMSDNTRVCLASDNGKDVGLGVMVFGRRYYDSDHSATILVAEGDARNQLLEYFLDMARVLGSKIVYYESRADDTIKGEPTLQRYIEIA